MNDPRFELSSLHDVLCRKTSENVPRSIEMQSRAFTGLQQGVADSRSTRQGTLELAPYISCACWDDQIPDTIPYPVTQLQLPHAINVSEQSSHILDC